MEQKTLLLLMSAVDSNNGVTHEQIDPNITLFLVKRNEVSNDLTETQKAIISKRYVESKDRKEIAVERKCSVENIKVVCDTAVDSKNFVTKYAILDCASPQTTIDYLKQVITISTDAIKRFQAINKWQVIITFENSRFSKIIILDTEKLNINKLNELEIKFEVVYDIPDEINLDMKLINQPAKKELKHLLEPLSIAEIEKIIKSI